MYLVDDTGGRRCSAEPKQDVYVIRDDYDQHTVCVVSADSQESALAFALAEYGEPDGDYYVAFVGVLHQA